MSIVWRYYLGIVVGFLVVAMYALTKLPIFLILTLGIWLFYAFLRCPDCKTLFKRNRLSWWRLPSTTCLKCGRDLTQP
jgi:hypothetical protein